MIIKKQLVAVSLTRETRNELSSYHTTISLPHTKWNTILPSGNTSTLSTMAFQREEVNDTDWNTRSAPVKSFSIAQSLAQRGHHVGIGSAVYFQRRLADPNAGDQIILHWQRRQFRKYLLRFLRRF